MNRCPVCGRWTLDFDHYFGRFRCYNPDCVWMPASSSQMWLMRRRGRTSILSTKRTEEGLTITSEYDPVNDALVFDFGLDEPTFDLPESDGIMVWRMGIATGSVAGFAIHRARESNISSLRIDIAARKKHVEDVVRAAPWALAAGRPSRVLVDRVSVKAEQSRHAATPGRTQMQEAFDETLDEFQAQVAGRSD
jgi:hypothetical protein